MTIRGGPAAVLVVDDEPLIRETLREFLLQEGFTAVACASGEEALSVAEKRPFDVALCDVNLPGLDGLEVLERLQRISPETAVVLITAYATVESAVEAFHKGASDYLMKPILLREVLSKVRRLLRLQDVERENRWLRRELHREAESELRIVGRSAPLRRVVELANKVAPTSSSVLILGESGTGKELLARLIHRQSQAAQANIGPFVAVNCAAIADGTQEEELLGAAVGGTVFLDEVAELSHAMQARLLRRTQALSEPQKARRPRILAATNKNLMGEVAAGRFREDLFYRLNVVNMALPPLRERVEDLPELAEWLLAKHARAMGKRVSGISREALSLLRGQPWKGNVRELENALQRAVIVTDGPIIQPEDLPPDFSRHHPEPAFVDDLNIAVDAFERQHIERILQQTPDKKEASRRLNIGLSSLYRKIEHLGITPPSERVGS